jgi:hypothetical protein
VLGGERLRAAQRLGEQALDGRLGLLAPAVEQGAQVPGDGFQLAVDDLGRAHGRPG